MSARAKSRRPRRGPSGARRGARHALRAERGGAAGATLPAIYTVQISHVRAEPVRHDVRHRSYLWFVDLDDLPRHGGLARFEPRDHVGDPGRSLRANVDAYLAEHGIDLRGGKIT